MIFKEGLLKECVYKTSRSSGAGGQHVNKVETKVSIYFNVSESNILNEDQKAKLKIKLSNRIDKNGLLHISSQKFKSQIKNKKNCQIKFLDIIEKALKKEKKRIKVKISKEAKLKRLKEKRIKSYLKNSRRNPKLLDE